MKRAISVLFLLVSAGFAQSRSSMVDYALLLEDAPVAQKAQGRLALQSADAQAQMARIRSAQDGLLAELRSRKVAVGGAAQVLVNAIFVRTTPEIAAQLLTLPGVAHVVRVPHMHRDLNTALGLVNVPGAWSAISGGVANAGAGMKIGIIDSGIDQNHAGFQDSSLTPPAGFPKGDSNYTNNKVIVARSYVALDSYTDIPPAANPVYSTPDDVTPRDRVGHGTAIAMIAAGVQNTGSQGTIQGVAPKAFLGNYKIFGSPGVNDFAFYLAFHQALLDAVADGMDVVTLSLSEGNMPSYGPLDVDPTCSSDGVTALACDIYAQAVESASNAGLVVVTAAGNDGNIGVLPHTLSTIHTPGTAPSGITVGATVNSHLLYQAVHVGGSSVPTSLQTIRALYGDGPHVVPATAPIKDVAQTGDNGLACSALPAGSMAGAVALIQRGSCVFADKINFAQQAGAVGVILYQSVGIDTIYNTLGAQNTGIPAMMVGYTDGVNLKNFIDSNSGITATFDQAFTAVSTTANTMWPASSRGPSIGSLNAGQYQTFVVKPELVAVGSGIYTATQKLDPNGEVYNPSGYTNVTGTSYAVPMVAGAVALVKQLHPTWTPAQLKSAVVNTATQDVTDTDGSTAHTNAAGAGKLSAADAMKVAATLNPATIAFGPVASSPVNISRNLGITNVSSASATFNVTVQPLTISSAAISVSPSTLTLAAGAQNSFTVKLAGALPSAGSYDGFIVITGPAGTSTLRVPYQFQVGSGIPADIFPIVGGSFLGATNDINWLVAFRLSDANGVPVSGPVQFKAGTGGGTVTATADTQTFRYGVAGALVNLGPQPGPQTFTGTANGLTVTFNGYARPFPAIGANSVLDAASFHTDYSLAPGSYITIKGSNLSDTTQVFATSYLPVSLSTVSVSFDGGGLSLPGHLHFVSPGQINVQVPWEFQGQSSVAMKVTVAGNTTDLQSNVFTVPLANYAPAFFMNSGTVADAVDNSTGALITTANPAAAGEILQLYANGLGPVTNVPASGEPAGAPLSLTTGAVTVSIGGKQATVFGGTAFLAPGFVGLYQINIQVPAGLTPGPQPITVTVGGRTSPTTANGSTIVLPVK
jgi:minor extracellular serine protease Vpr